MERKIRTRKRIFDAKPMIKFKKHTKQLFALKLTAFILLGVSAGMLTTAILISAPKAKQAIFNTDKISALSAAIGQNSTLTKPDGIVSTFGFSTVYDKSIIKAAAQTTDPSSDGKIVSGVEYEGDELTEDRDYSMFKFELKSADEDGLLLTQRARLTISTNIHDDYFTSRASQSDYAGKSNIDILTQVITTTALKDAPNTTASTPTDVSINDVNYRKISFVTTYNSLGDIITTNTADYYLTVQNGRPYWASVTNIDTSTKDQVALLEPIIASTTYTQPKASILTGASYKPASATLTTLPTGLSYIPKPIDSATILQVVAKNQPAVVRIGTVKCVDASLSNKDNSIGFTLKHACGGGIGSGSIVSSDGYIATNGHVTRLTDSMALDNWAVSAYINGAKDGTFTELRGLLDYLGNIGTISSSRIEPFITELKSGDQGAIGALYELSSLIPPSAIKITDSRASYAIQTSTEPLRLTNKEGADLSFGYSNTILAATYVDSDYDPDVDLSSSFGVTSDVSILKMDGTFPIVTLGSIAKVDTGNQVTAIGYPGFVDGGVNTKQTKTVPAITQGVVKGVDVSSKTSSYKLIYTTVPIAQGNSGGPAFNNDGEQIGLNTYGSIECQDQQCFGEGIARDIADYKALLQKNNINLNTNSAISTEWNKGLDSFQSGNYRQAVSSFNSVASIYPANYLAKSLSELASSRIGSSDDTSGFDPIVIIIISVSALTFIGGVIVVIVVIRHRKKLSNTAMAQPTATQQPPAVAPLSQTTPNIDMSVNQTPSNSSTPFSPFAPVQPPVAPPSSVAPPSPVQQNDNTPTQLP